MRYGRSVKNFVIYYEDEMISLGAVESAIGRVLPEETEVLATVLPDGKKGEKVALLFAGGLDREGLEICIAQAQLNPLMTPSALIKVEAIPKLGSGKSDFNQARQLALAALENN